jgi:hypothetical protein
VAVTVNVWTPGVEVSSAAPDGWPFASHDEIPGPPAPSAQLKLESTTWLSLYAAPLAGTAIEMLGGLAPPPPGLLTTVYVSVTCAAPAATPVLHPEALQ